MTTLTKTMCLLSAVCAYVLAECTIIDTEYSNPVTDFTGKTVYTKRTVYKECPNTSPQQIGCNKWEITTQNGTLDFNTSGVGTIFKQQSGGDQASHSMAMLEEQFHLFSGWEGYCDSGTLFSNPFEDPMKLLSYAMMVYGAASSKEGVGVQAINDAANKAQETYNAIAESTSNLFDDVVSKLGLTNPPTVEELALQLDPATAEAYLSSTSSLISGSKSITEMITEISKLNTIAIDGLDLTIDMPWGTVMEFYYTDVLQLGMAMMPTEQEMKSAQDFNMAWMGSQSTSPNSIAYANCMASIGLSYPNLISNFAGFKDDGSPELKATYENPISLTYVQLGHLVKATDLVGATSPSELPSQEQLAQYLDGGYIDSSYILLSNNTQQQRLVLVAKNPLAYFQAGQAICGGKLASVQNIVTASASSEEESANYGEAVATFAVKKILATLPPPYNIIATVILDVIMSLDSVNACTNLEEATKMGVLQMKTNRFLNFDQCYYVKDTCADKVFGQCILDRHHHCCYDQISTRIFAEGIKEQLGLDMKVCNNITMEHLKEISFVKCEPSQDAFTHHCFPAAKWDEFVKALNARGVVDFDFKAAADQAINSLAIPRSLCEVNASNP